MFDRPPVSETANDEAHEAVERLCALYDRLLEQVGDGGLSEAASAELRAMAGIYDLDLQRTDAEVWADLRAVLIRQTPRPKAAETTAPEPLTLLLVEDDPETAADLTLALVEAGHSVVGPFQNAEAAEAAAALHLVDLALLDINLTGETTGIDLARALKDRWGLPSLFLTGDIGAAARHADLAEALVLKPYTGAQVLEAITRVTTH
ncbi:response regulator [Brevundimonas goettingensis]|uniref:Response regulator n=1 Tax=Brevundimonas goettingensis TaxID=2774190 RepID=A0A975GXM4_9CAUL|nr:response regulator [Brevundimonas goettingensis]QTC90685.1 response regulator [Brevundimonas goettingensis]